jgi:hypothetical protein
MTGSWRFQDQVPKQGAWEPANMDSRIRGNDGDGFVTKAAKAELESSRLSQKHEFSSPQLLRRLSAHLNVQIGAVLSASNHDKSRPITNSVMAA